MKTQFDLQITSVPDKGKLVAELWYDDELFAEISNETELNIEIYSSKKKLNYSLLDFLSILEVAKNKLLDKDGD